MSDNLPCPMLEKLAWQFWWFTGLLADARVQDILSRPQGDLGNSSDGVRLQLANALFVQSGVKLLPEFTQHALGWGNSSLLSVNFSNPNHTHSRLQQWTRSQSKGELIVNAVSLKSPHVHHLYLDCLQCHFKWWIYMAYKNIHKYTQT